MTSQSTSSDLNPSQTPRNLKGTIDLMAAAIEMPATMEIMHSKDVWVCNTAASNHFAKSKDGAYNCCKTDGITQGMTGGHVEVSMLVGFTVTHCTKQ